MRDLGRKNRDLGRTKGHREREEGKAARRLFKGLILHGGRLSTLNPELSTGGKGVGRLGGAVGSVASRSRKISDLSFLMFLMLALGGGF
jgi:hypothetical protein